MKWKQRLSVEMMFTINDLFWSVILMRMRELLYQAAEHFKKGKSLTEQGDLRGAVEAYGKALHDLHAVKPQRMRDVLLAQVYLSRYQLEKELHDTVAMTDLRLGYSYARTAREPSVQELAEKLWQASGSD